MPSPDSAPSDPPFYTRYGFARTGDRNAPLTIDAYPEIGHAGALQATIIASAIDLVGGLHTREIAGVDATFTADLSLRIPRPAMPPRLLARGTLLRSGRRLVTTGVSIEAEGKAYAYGTTTFTRIPRDPTQAPDLASLSLPERIEQHPLDRPLIQEVGVETVEARSGHVRLPLRPALLNPEGIMQGALVALIVESAALALAEHAASSPQVVTEMDLRYLAAASQGPCEARAEWIGGTEGQMLRVELRDTGRADRLTTAALVRVTSARGN